MAQSKFKIGDKVKIINVGRVFSTYDEMAKIMGLKNWSPIKYAKKESIATVIHIRIHPARYLNIDLNIVLGIRTEDGTEHIISEEGLELLTETKTSDVIKISRKHLNEYYDHSNTEQRNFINDNFKVDGTTTISAIIELERIASDFLKPVIRKNHPECFAKPEFDFSKYVKKYSYDIFTTEQSKLLGFNESPIEIRSCGEYKHKAFYLNNDEVEWKLIKEGPSQVLVPIKN